jgi:hypothetical protein
LFRSDLTGEWNLVVSWGCFSDDSYCSDGNSHLSGGLHIDNTGYAYPDAGPGIDIVSFCSPLSIRAACHGLGASLQRSCL